MKMDFFVINNENDMFFYYDIKFNYSLNPSLIVALFFSHEIEYSSRNWLKNSLAFRDRIN